MTNAEQFDPSYTERLKKLGGDKLLQDLLAMYRERTPEKMEQIRSGLESRTAETIQAAAHSLISSAGNLGGTQISKLAVELESAAIIPDFDRIALLWEELSTASEQFERFLDTLMDRS